jgi:hypothetical protein
MRQRSITVSSFNLDPDGLTSKQIGIFKEADTIFCETLSKARSTLEKAGVDTSNKNMFCISENGEAPTNPIFEIAVPYIRDNFKKENIVIISDDGLPNISDPYAGVITTAVRMGINVRVEPNISSVMSAIMFSSSSGGNGYIFGGMLSHPADATMLDFLAPISRLLPIVFVTRIDNLADAEDLQEELWTMFTPNCSITMLFNLGEDSSWTVHVPVNKFAQTYDVYSKQNDKALTTIVLHNYDY